MTAYITAQIDIHDQDRYEKYGQGFMQVFSRFQGKMLVVDESPEILEGQWAYTRTVLIEFPSAQSAKAWYFSDAYQELADHRWGASFANVVLLEGIAGRD
jgi:uncharacterized protein (DUF1330 family)